MRAWIVKTAAGRMPAGKGAVDRVSDLLGPGQTQRQGRQHLVLAVLAVLAMLEVLRDQTIRRLDDPAVPRLHDRRRQRANPMDRLQVQPKVVAAPGGDHHGRFLDEHVAGEQVTAGGIPEHR